jgi:hypothetical protein
VRPDNSLVRRYRISLEDRALVVRERISSRGEHSCVIKTVVDGQTKVVTRLVVDSSGRVRYGPEELYRVPGWSGDWLTVLFGLDDLIDVLLT